MIAAWLRITSGWEKYNQVGFKEIIAIIVIVKGSGGEYNSCHLSVRCLRQPRSTLSHIKWRAYKKPSDNGNHDFTHSRR